MVAERINESDYPLPDGHHRHLPELPLPVLDADRVDASAEAYSRFSTPDGIFGIGNYADTMGLAAMGGQIVRRNSPGFPSLWPEK